MLFSLYFMLFSFCFHHFPMGVFVKPPCNFYAILIMFSFCFHHFPMGALQKPPCNFYAIFKRFHAIFILFSSFFHGGFCKTPMQFLCNFDDVFILFSSFSHGGFTKTPMQFLCYFHAISCYFHSVFIIFPWGFYKNPHAIFMLFSTSLLDLLHFLHFKSWLEKNQINVLLKPNIINDAKIPKVLTICAQLITNR